MILWFLGCVGLLLPGATALKNWRNVRGTGSLEQLIGVQRGVQRVGRSSHVEPEWRKDGVVTFAGLDANVTCDVEVPETFSHFMRGLMWRSSMDNSQCMLFRWSRDQLLGFWMENTYVPLDIVYVNDAGVIVSIGQGVPESTASVQSSGYARYAVELVQGWCEENGVGVGDSVTWALSSDASGSFEAREGPAFGANKTEVRQAVADGVFNNV